MAAWLFLGASIAWLVLLGAAALPDEASLPVVSSSVLRLASFLCHQQVERSFHWHGEALAVCARCLGLYALAPLGAAAALAARRPLAPRRVNILLLAIAGLPTAATWMLEHLAGWPMTNAIRFIAALPLGAAVAWVIAQTLADAPPRHVSQYTLPDARRG